MIPWAEWDRCPPGPALREADPDIARLIDREVERQLEGLELIASENFVSPAVLEAMGSPLTNKYAEGLPGKRYYGGCEFVDQVEQIAIDRAKQLFGAAHANVQPHSGAQANAAAFFAFLTPVPRAAARSHNEPLSILKRRYAAGEITSAEFDERRVRLLDETSPRHDAGWRADAPPPRRTISDERGAHH